MAFPLDAMYFPLIFEKEQIQSADVAGIQHPKLECLKKLREMRYARHGEKYVDVKAFPHLHPWGDGGWYHKRPIPFMHNIKISTLQAQTWLSFLCA